MTTFLVTAGMIILFVLGIPVGYSLGIAGMEERAALLGGSVNVQSRPGYGTEVEALIPYHHAGGPIPDHPAANIEEIKK